MKAVDSGVSIIMLLCSIHTYLLPPYNRKSVQVEA